MTDLAAPASTKPTLWGDGDSTPHTGGTAPLLKWPGGKRWLVPKLLRLVPADIQRYFEGFAGGAALYFAVQPSRAILADNSADLINCYTQVRDCPASVIESLSRLKNTEQAYYEVRMWMPNDPVDRAARLIYLVTLSFNGIYRENAQGKFNVPYGHKTHLNPCDPAKILAASAALARCDLMHADFEAVLGDAQYGDLIYLDPPYTVTHGNNGFVKYNAKIFSWADQERLAELAGRLDKRGCIVIISNAAHPSIAELYRGFEREEVVRPSVMAADRTYRKAVTEYIIHNRR